MGRPSIITPTIWTIGHSTRSLEAFLGLLRIVEIQLLVDVRRFPASRRYPHFTGTELRQSLMAAAISYEHMPDLGGRRPARKDSVNLGWRNRGFRGYADYMGSDEFESALEQLVQYGQEHRAAIMCAEAVPWRCHRTLIADALVARGWQVTHILSEHRVDPHHLTSFAAPSNGRLTYPTESSQPPLF